MPMTATSHGTRARPTVVSVAFAGLLASSSPAQQPSSTGPESRDLAKQLSNPLASLVSVPFQFNWEQNVGPSKLTRFVLNVQPVMPFVVKEKVNLIVRLIAPFISQPPLAASGTATFGIRRRRPNRTRCDVAPPPRTPESIGEVLRPIPALRRARETADRIPRGREGSRAGAGRATVGRSPSGRTTRARAPARGPTASCCQCCARELPARPRCPRSRAGRRAATRPTALRRRHGWRFRR